jgi:nicotinamidase-related amidase
VVEVGQRRGPHKHHAALAEPEIRSPKTALLIIDMQYHGASRDHGLIKQRVEAGEPEAVAYVADRLERTVVPNIRRLQDAFRAAKMEVVHVKTQSLTRDGRDRSPSAKRHGTHVRPGTRTADILDDIAPIEDEVVISKTCGGVFNCTNIDYVLRNIGIETLVVTGMVTGSCVDLAIRDAADRGYFNILVEDGTASWSPEMQAEAVEALRDRSAKVMSAADIVARLAGEPAQQTHAHART